ncbi:uncharacterized protein LOC119981444 isoform X2 [Tripterygium wilfordii]|uniref:uncharacterized protein LOC119981444 isoform X2 n=1 Tax=Tripterygium wilfordii TaxID=458696 RepID=UPI0018F7EC79|nr:uncharacterized protein LOC119981444 isoform X2 [Tripterygium wilfordii]
MALISKRLYWKKTARRSSGSTRRRLLQIDHSVEARIERLKKDVAEIGEEQRCIREGQREVKKKIETIRSNCAQLRRETQLMCMQSTIFNHKLNIMLQIMHARKRGDVDKAQKLTQFLFDDRFS